MTAPTLNVEIITAEQNVDKAIYVSAEEIAWMSLGASLVEMHAEQDAARFRVGATPIESDTAGFAARGLELGVEAWNDVTADHQGASRVWGTFARLVAADMSGGYTEAVRSGLLLALTRMESVRAEYRATYGG